MHHGSEAEHPYEDRRGSSIGKASTTCGASGDGTGSSCWPRECAVVVIVDVLSFCTSVDVAVGRGARVLPQRWHDPDAAREAAAHGACGPGRGTATGRRCGRRRCSAWPRAPCWRCRRPTAPPSAPRPPAMTCVVLAGCLRNATAVATAARSAGGPIGVVPAGERWPDDTLRVAAEDALGAGAIIAALGRPVALPGGRARRGAVRRRRGPPARSTGRARLGPGADRRRLRRRRRPGRGPRRQPDRPAARRRRPGRLRRATGQLARRNGQLTAAGCRTHRVEMRLAVSKIATRRHRESTTRRAGTATRRGGRSHGRNIGRLASGP